MKIQIFQVDAFTNKPFGGNPAAVVPLTEWLPDEVMLGIAAENNLAETAFFVKNGGRYEIRWFTPKVEVNLCGHATLASADVIFNELKLESSAIKFHSHKSGELGVTKNGDRFVLDFPAYPMKEIEPIPMLVEAEVPPLRYWESQGNMLFLLLEDQKAVEDLEPDMHKVLELPYDEMIIMAQGEDCDFASRMFAPRIGIPEDPVTGAIHCSLIPYWAGVLGKNKLFARQVSKRGGELFCELAGDRVKIGGNAVLYLKGEIYVEAGSEKSVGVDVEIRLAVPGDEVAIAELIFEAFLPFHDQYTPDAFDYTAASADRISERFAEGPMWLAYIDDEAVGTVSGLPEEERFYIRSMAVKPSAQGKQVGQKLLDALEEHARDAGFEKLYLYTTFVLPGARPLYEKNGFHVLRETAPEEWFGMGGLEMEKILK